MSDEVHTFARSFTAPLGYPAESALAPPQSEVGAAYDAAGNEQFSWAEWWPVRNGPCKSFADANPCGIESDMWTLVRALMSPSATVLELGARYGTTSCVIAQAINNSGRVVSVEPDARALVALRQNLLSHRCNVGVFNGTVGRNAQSLLTDSASYDRQRYQTRTHDAADANAAAASSTRSTRNALLRLDHLTVAALERLSGLTFDTLVVDCEGCLDDVLSDALLERLNLILIETDVPRKVNYVRWHLRLVSSGFVRIWRLEDSMYKSFAPMHVAYQRVGTPRLPSCIEYAKLQAGWRCQQRTSLIRQGFVNPMCESLRIRIAPLTAAC